MARSIQLSAWTTIPKWPGASEEGLDRALVAGLMLEAVLELGRPALEPQAHRQRLKTRLQDTLVSRLAGRITLDRFRSLVRALDHWFPFYYPLLSPDQEGPMRGLLAALGTGSEPPPRRGLRHQLLEEWLQVNARQLLPQRPHGKLRVDKLAEFLRHTRGSWFRLKDFEAYFHIDRKTAWEYLQKFQHAGLLRHNQGRSAAVRYGLDDRFLVVRAEGVRQRAAQVLSGLDPSLAAPAADWLIASGGEAFWTWEWEARLPSRRSQEVISHLLSGGLLEAVQRSGPHQLLRLPRRWLQQENRHGPESQNAGSPDCL